MAGFLEVSGFEGGLDELLDEGFVEVAFEGLRVFVGLSATALDLVSDGLDLDNLDFSGGTSLASLDLVESFLTEVGVN